MRTQFLFLVIVSLLLASFSINAQTDLLLVKSGVNSYFDSTDTIHYEPVLGVDGKTYINAEEAQAAGIYSWEGSQGGSYRTASIDQPNMTWIEYLEINGMQMDSPHERKGYQDQSNYIFDLFGTNTNYLFLNAQQLQETCEMSWRIWIDFNENHEFEKEEMVFEGEGQQQEIQLRLPTELPVEFITRMRIAWTAKEAKIDSDSLAVGSVKDVSVYIQ
ncbi:MAG: hypothetical protein KTR30_22975 [Saprospiraceae bacterium]|nr:hypothetical protein [Saprospiraceae bacterium]